MSNLTPPPTMRAWTFTARGTPRNVLSLNLAYPVPPPPAGSNLLVRVSHVALNPGSHFLMNLIPSIIGRTAIPELDFSGHVQLAGPAAPSHFAPGTAIFGSVSAPALVAGGGTLAEYVIVPADLVAVKPANVGFAEAAGSSSVGQTALNMIKKAGVKAGDRVLVNGASGGVGTMVVQAAKVSGLEVVATCSDANAEMVKGLGADRVVDYRAHDPLQVYVAKEYSSRPFDAVLDTVGTQALYENSPRYLKANGVYINIGAYEGAWRSAWAMLKNICYPRVLGGTPRKWVFFSNAPDGKVVKELADLMEEKKIKVVIDSIFDMKDALQGYDRIMTHRAQGKVIIKVQED